MASTQSPPYGKPQGNPPPQYWELHNYPPEPTSGQSQNQPRRSSSPAYDNDPPPVNRIAVPNAYGRFSDSGPSAAVPLRSDDALRYSSGDNQPSWGHSGDNQPVWEQPRDNQPVWGQSGDSQPSWGQPRDDQLQPVHISVPHAFERSSGSDVDVPLRSSYSEDYSPKSANSTVMSVPGAFDRQAYAGYASPSPKAFDGYTLSGRPISGSSHPERVGDTVDYVARSQIEALGVGYSFSTSFSDKAIRRAFIRKVYLILTTQLMVTIGFIAAFVFVDPIQDWLEEGRNGLWCYIASYITFLITYFILICFQGLRRKSPWNFICLAVFTVAFSILTAIISSYHETKSVLLAAGITGAVCLSVTLFAIQTKIDFTMCSGLIFALMSVLFFFGISCIITYYCWGYNHILDSVYAGLGALVFAVVLIYNTQMIVGGRKHEISAEEYIYGALQLYLDVVYIFLFMLSLFGKKK